MNTQLISGVEKLIRECPLNAYAYIIAILLQQAGGEVKIDYATLKNVRADKLTFNFHDEPENQQLVISLKS